MNRWMRFFGMAVLVLVLVALDAAFFPAIGESTRYFNITLIAALYTIIILREKMAVTMFVSGMLFMGFTASESIVVPLALGLLSLAVVNALFNRFFTNRSYYTLLALGTIGWVLYYVPYDLIRLLNTILFDSDAYRPVFNLAWAEHVLLGFMFLLVMLSCAYVGTAFFSKRFRSYFIVTDRTV